MKYYFSALIGFVFLFVLPCNVILAQVSFGGKPLVETIALPTPPVVEFPAPDLKQIKLEDDQAAVNQQPYRIAVAIGANYDVIQSAQQTKVSKGSVWRVILHSTGARALSVTFDRFYIPEQGKLFLYDATQKKKIGAFTSENNNANKIMATEILPGESVTIEYFQPASVTDLPQLVVSELLYVYRSPGYDPAANFKNFGEAGSCEVNVNCPEGQPFINQKQGVVRMYVRSGTSAFWCTGSVMNNTNRDFKPYILSAAHCRESAPLTDFSKWVFYFNYQAPTCANPLTEPAYKTMSGATLVAISGSTSNQSDFMLVKLNQAIPIDYNAWYFGWSRETTSNPGAVGIHHPSGDIKKISTVLNAPVAVNAYGGSPDPNGTDWQVSWKSTASGYGVTEPGSSGSPLVNADGRVIGTLSGGSSACSNTGAMDYYGKVSYHWNLNGTTSDVQLGPWLDPINSSITSFAGGYNNNNISAQFSSDATTIPPNFSINFKDLSLGNPTQWSWSFVGGVPSTSTSENPQGISYANTGSYDVQLIAANSFQKDTILLKGYVKVKYPVSPNPTQGLTELFVSKDILPQFDVIINSVEGAQISRFTVTNSNKVNIDLSNQRSGVYFITVLTTGNTQTYKIVVAR